MDKDFFIHSINPIAIHLGDFPLSWYWLFYPLSFFGVFLFSLKLNDKIDALDRNELIDRFLVGWVGLLIGSRLTYVLFYNLEIYLQNPEYILQFWTGGMSFHGALLGGFLGNQFYSFWKKRNSWPFYDLLVYGLPIALFFGRIGNFINGELVGRASEVPWAIIFPNFDQVPRHPSQIYEALLEGPILFFLLFIFRHRLLIIEGRSSAFFLIGYGALRFAAEFTREPDPQLGFIIWIFSMGQLMSLGLIIWGLVIIKFNKSPLKS
jgi:phosphatidylglycerol:prolipoprotein diacylglycerol transferase